MEAAKTIVDSSVLVAAFNEHDSLHKKAIKFMDECPKPFILHEYVIAETATVLMNRMGKHEADRFLYNSLANADSRIIHSSKDFFQEFIDEFIQLKAKQLSFVDAALLFLSKDYKILTFDDALNRAIKKKAQS